MDEQGKHSENIEFQMTLTWEQLTLLESILSGIMGTCKADLAERLEPIDRKLVNVIEQNAESGEDA